MTEPIVRKKNRSAIQNHLAPRYLLLTLLSFAFSLSATRLFLYLTGFPQIGKGELHIAHVLWGGLFLFIACLLPLIYANEWARSLSAIITGLGIGLFIDEVGKFITANNDYFYQSAAPIIYVFFLLTVLLFIQIRSHQKPSPRSEMYAVLDDLSEVLDSDLSEDERQDLLRHLSRLTDQEVDPNVKKLAQSLTVFLSSAEIQIVPHRLTPVERVKAAWQKFENGWLTQKRLKTFLFAGLLLWGIWALFYPFGYFFTQNDPVKFQNFMQSLLTDRLVKNASGLNWVETRVYLEGAMGLISLIAAGMILTRAERTGVLIGYIDLLLTLTIVNILIFYFDQFSTIFFALIQLLLFLGLIRYRNRFHTNST